MLFGLVQGGFPRGVLPRRWGPTPLPPLWSCALLGMFLSFLLGCIPTHLHRHQEGSGCVSDPTFRLQRVRGNPSCAPPARGLSDTDPNEHAKSINPFWLIGSCAARSRSRDHRTCRGFAVQGCAEPLWSRGRGSSGCHHIALRRSGGVNAVLPVLLPKLHPKRCRVEMWGLRLCVLAEVMYPIGGRIPAFWGSMVQIQALAKGSCSPPALELGGMQSGDALCKQCCSHAAGLGQNATPHPVLLTAQPNIPLSSTNPLTLPGRLLINQTPVGFCF